MIVVGIAVTLLGFVLSVAGLGIASSVTGRLVFVLVGIALSLAGILGILNRYYLSRAIWRR